VAIDHKETCSAHAYHGFMADFEEKLSKRSFMMPILFVVFCLLSGAFFRIAFPSWLPYTVGLLIVGMVLGVIANTLAFRTECPMFALAHDVDGDGRVSPAEYAEFIGATYHPGSFCLDAVAVSSEAGRGQFSYPTTCGDGTGEPAGCGYTFAQLDLPFKVSSMLAESAFYFPSSSGSGSPGSGSAFSSGSTSSSGNLEGDGYRL
jgi:uncharacterized membrane protein YgcG